MPIEELIDNLACPVCKGNLSSADDKSSLLCIRCKLLYPVRGGIPVMLVDEALKTQ